MSLSIGQTIPLQQLTVQIWIRSGFFHTVSHFTNDSEFCKLWCLLKGLQVTFEYLDREKSI